MHVCFVYVRYYTYCVSGFQKKSVTDYNQINLGISYISSMLKKNGHTTELLCYHSFNESYIEILKQIERKPQVFAVSVVGSKDYKLVLPFLKLIKKYYKESKVIVGGAFATIHPEIVVQNEEVDAIGIGEGEYAIPEYVNQVAKGQYHKVDNLWIKNGNEIIKCDRSVFIEDIDKLPFPDRQIWDKWATAPKNHSVLLMRGCKYRCKYCGNRILATKSQGTYVRYRSINNIIEEIKNIRKIYVNTQTITFYVENALANIDYFCNLCRALIELNDSLSNKLQFFLYLNFTPNLLNKDLEVIKLLKKANIRYVSFALESGSLEIRNKLNRPYYTNEDFISFCKILQEGKIHIIICTMYCFPYETNKTYWQTINCVRQCKPDLLNYTWLSSPENAGKKVKFIDRCRYFLFRWLVLYKYKNLAETIYFSIAPYKIFDNIIKFWKDIVAYKVKQSYKNKEFAKEAMDKGNFKKAIKYFNKVHIDDTNYWIYGDRAIAKMAICDYKGAMKDFDKVLELEPKEIYREKREECLKKINKK